MMLTCPDSMKQSAGYRAGCLCRFTFDASDPERLRCYRTPVMGCPVHDLTTSQYCNDAVVKASGSRRMLLPGTEEGREKHRAFIKKLFGDPDEIEAEDARAEAGAPPTLPPFIHGRLGDPEPGSLFQVVCDGPNDITITGLGLGLRMDRATLTALWRAAADGLNHLDERGR